MATINEYFENAQFAQAAYAELYRGISIDKYKDALNGAGMVQTQYEQFATKYTVIDQYSSSGLSDFSGTVFQRKGDGKLFFAMRGTEGLLDSLVDAAIVTSGAAVLQIIEMSNYYQRLVAAPGADVVQFNTTLNPITGEFDTYTSTGAGKGLVNSGQQLTVAGHSLGGHLANAFAYLFPNATDSVYVYNSLGVQRNAFTENLFTTLGGNLALSIDSKVTHLYSEAGPEVVTNYYPVPGDNKPLFIEDQAIIGQNHKIGVLTDALAVYNLLATLEPTLTLNDLTPILQGADYYDPSILESLFGSSTNTSLENIVNGMGDLFGAGTVANPGNRDELYKRINDIQGNASYKNANGQLSVRSTAGISVEAAGSLAFRYAVMNLNSFAILGDDTLYDRFSSELALYDPLLRTGELTNNLVQDKSYFLNQLLAFNKTDDDPNAPVGNTTEYFKDYKTKTIMNNGLVNLITGDRNAKRYVFGDDGANLVRGGDSTDRLYGGGGNDVLMGTQFYSTDDNVSDYIEGGSGDDTYYVGAGDVVMDTDGVGELIYTDAAGTPYTFTGGRLVNGNYVSDDNKASYALSGTTLTITMQGVNDAITVNNFNDGDLGITLAGEWNTQIDYIFNMPYPPIGVPYETYIDANVLYNFPSTNTDAFVVQAGTGNDTFTGNYRTNRWYITEAALTAELEAFKAKNGFYFQYGGNFRAGDGDDRYFAGTPSDLSVMLDPNNTNNALERFYVTALGGAGNDMLVGSNGKDNLIGGTGNDTIISGPGDDIIYSYGGAKYIDLVGVNVPDIFKEDYTKINNPDSFTHDYMQRAA